MSKILYTSASLVPSVLDGTKTEHRFPIIPQPSYFFNCVMGEPKVIGDKFGGVSFDGNDMYIDLPYTVGEVVDVSGIPVRIESVRVQRLQDITEEEALREGVYFHPEMMSLKYSSDKVDNPDAVFWGTARDCFRYNLWYDKLPGIDKTPYGWDSNPWVFVVSFVKIDRTENP